MILTLCLLTFDAYAAGRVLFVKGDARYERSGEMRPLTKGTQIEAGDVLITGEDGRVQLLMDDGDRMALRPGTRLHIDEFNAPVTPQTPATGRAFYRLLSGGFRAITRSLGVRNEASYKIITPVATIGIRGTHYSLYLCSGNCSVSDGLYAGVSQGGIWMQNSAGQLNLGANQYGYVASQNSPPQQLTGAPDPLIEDTGGGSGDGSTGDGLSNRTSPAEGEMDPPGGPMGTPSQPIQGTDPQGNPFDLTPGQPGQQPVPQNQIDPAP